MTLMGGVYMKPKYTTTIALTDPEYLRLLELRDKKWLIIEIFRMGMERAEAEQYKQNEELDLPDR